MTENDEQYFWDKVTQGRSTDDFFNYLATEKPVLVPCEFCCWPSTIHYDGDRCTRAKEKNQQCSFGLYEKITKVLQQEMISRAKKEVAEEKTKIKEGDFMEFLRQQQSQQNTFLEQLLKSSLTKPSKLVKVSKPPLWTKDMSFETFKIQIERWNTKEKDISEVDKHHELIENMKTNKDVKDLAKYVNDEITEKNLKVEDQTVSKILDILEEKYGRSDLEKIEKAWEDLRSFKVSPDDNPEEVIMKMKKIVGDVTEKVDIKKNSEKFFSVWMLQSMNNAKYLSDFESQALRNELKGNEETKIE